jgi:7,8-dihydropterin-6-yl-methyl-4-(beta-D-ribofuranosyl)aminobenzene 5'-phosphate synthase
MVKILFLIVIMFDNYQYNPACETAWGFSAYIKANDRTIVFDTGLKADMLGRNIKTLELEMKNIDFIILSHEHNDHTGGLGKVLSLSPETTLIFPSIFSSGFKSKISDVKNRLEIGSESKEIAPGIFTSGTLDGPVKEQALFIKTGKGKVVITGCAHPGILKIVEKSIEVTGGKPYMVIGGFHLLRHTPEETRKIAQAMKKLGVKMVAPTHCTGDRAIEIFKKEFGKGFLKAGVGFRFDF